MVLLLLLTDPRCCWYSLFPLWWWPLVIPGIVVVNHWHCYWWLTNCYSVTLFIGDWPHSPCYWHWPPSALFNDWRDHCLIVVISSIDWYWYWPLMTMILICYWNDDIVNIDDIHCYSSDSLTSHLLTPIYCYYWWYSASDIDGIVIVSDIGIVIIVYWHCWWCYSVFSIYYCVIQLFIGIIDQYSGLKTTYWCDDPLTQYLLTIVDRLLTSIGSDDYWWLLTDQTGGRGPVGRWLDSIRHSGRTNTLTTRSIRWSLHHLLR